jgi:ABC-type transport system involved in multi-copper enzyme maturation permease subunit
LFSILFRSTATSALAALAVWIFFSFFVSLGANVLANALASEPADTSLESAMRRAKIVRAFILTSPMELYTDATTTIIDPMRKSARSAITMAAPASKYIDCGALYYLADCPDGGLFCHFLCGIHAAGNPFALKIEG